MRRDFVKLVVVLASAAMLAGCIKKPPPRQDTVYTGPTLPLDELLKSINANNARISTLNATGTFLLSIPSEVQVSGQIDTLFHTKPNQLRMRGENIGFGRIFDLGTDGSRFWLYARGKQSTTWLGTNPGPAETSNVPISPSLMADVLGVATLNLDLLAQPIPTLRFNPDYRAYMLTWHQPLVDRWVTLREVWYDLETLRPKYVWLFDRNGRVILRAKLDRFEPMSTAEKENAPVTARTFELFFPETGASFRFTLDDVRDQHAGRPNGLSYRFNPTAENPDRIIDLDQPAPQP